MQTASFAAVEIVAAVASALPKVLSFLSAHRSITTSPITPSDSTATIVVAGALRDELEADDVVVHDTVRLGRLGEVHKKMAELGECQQQLVGRKIVLTDSLSTAKAEAEDLKKKLETLRASSGAAVGEEEKDKRARDIDQVAREFAARRKTISDNPVLLGLIDSLLAAIDEYRDAPTFTHVLFVHGESGSAQQLVNDKAWWFKDDFSVVAMVALSYLLLDPVANNVASGGIVSDSRTG